MKERMFRTLMLLAVLATLGVASAYAQVDTTIQASIPFNFTVRGRTLPAGMYYIKQLNDTDPNLLEIRSADYRRVAIFTTIDDQAARAPKSSELVFDRIGDKYFLSQVWVKGNNIGEELPKTRADRRMEGAGARIENRTVTGQ
jgi:hypothetical protein